VIGTATSNSFAGASLLEPICRRQHIQFIERRIAGDRLVDAPQRPTHVVGDVNCREFSRSFPCPGPSYPAEQEGWVAPSLRQWAKSTQTHSTDQNLLCESRYNRHIFCSGRIPAAGTTTALWQMDCPRVPDAYPLKTLSERIRREKRLIREQRESRWLLAQIVGGYESDWHTQAEREDLLRATKKARRCPHGLPPRSIVKDIDGRVPLRVVPTLKTGRLPKPPEELLSKWNEILYEASKDDSTPLREEIDFYPPRFAEANFDGRERSSDDERVSEFEFDSVNNNGVRETTSEVPNDVNRSLQYQLKYNPHGKSRAAIEQQVRKHPDFLVDAARVEIQTTNAPIVEVAEQLGVGYDWLRQQLSRGNQVLDLYGSDPQTALIRELLGNHTRVPDGFNIVIRLNNRVEIKRLGDTDSPQQNLDALLRLQKATMKDALKYERKKARKNGLSNEELAMAEQAARARVQEAYRLCFELFRSQIE